MSRRIAVRLPDDLVAFVDTVVASGEAPSRAAVIARALDRERRRTAAARDAEIPARTTANAEATALAEYSSGPRCD